MAVWGIGAHYRGSNPADKTNDFIRNGGAFIGWGENEAPALFRMFDSIKIGDIIYIKSFSPRSKKLNIKNVGIVTSTKQFSNTLLGAGIKVSWKKNFCPFSISLTPELYRNNVFNNTLYEEFNETIIERLISQLI